MTTLAEELLKAPYLTLEDGAAAEKLNTDTVAWNKSVTRAELNAIAGATGGHAAIQDVVERLASPTPTAAQRSACLTAWRMLDAADAVLDLNDPAQSAILATIESIDATLASFGSALRAYAAITVPVSQTLTDLGRPARESDVHRARMT